MQGYAVPIVLAFVVFPFLAVLALFPYVAVQYRRRGRVGFGPALLAAGFTIYVVGVILLVLLPLPDFGGDFCARHAAKAQLHLFQFVDDMRKEKAVDGGRLLLGNAAFQVRVFNIALFVPLGMFVRHLFGRGFVVTVLIGFLASLAIELTQLTAVWGLFPCAWRHFDVDDLWSNTLGALIGACAAPMLRLVPGQKEKAPPGTPRRVTVWRRLLGMACDGVLVVVIGQGLLIAASLAEFYLGDHSFAPLIEHRLESVLGWWLPGGLLLVLLPLVNGGRSPGQWAVLLRPERPDGSRAPWWRIVLQVAAGPVPLLVLAGGSAPYTGPLILLLLVANLVAAFPRDHRGLSGWVAGLRFGDARR